jgi:hypothetical protein
MNMTTKMAQRRPTTAPPITAVTFYTSISITKVHLIYIKYYIKILIPQPPSKCMHADRHKGTDGQPANSRTKNIIITFTFHPL